MEHYYIIEGNEFGAYMDSKINFSKEDLEKACEKFEQLKAADESFYVGLFFVNKEGKETVVEECLRY